MERNNRIGHPKFTWELMYHILYDIPPPYTW